MKKIKIPNISCNHCIMAIKKAVGELENAEVSNINLETKEVEISWSEPADWKSITDKLESIGYPAE